MLSNQLSAVKTETLAISTIRTDGNAQIRSGIDSAAVEAYAEALGQGEKLPAIVVFFDGSHHWLSDGFHRLAAARSIGRKSIAADVHAGTVDDARWYALGANGRHGLRLTRDEYAEAVRVALRMKPESSNRMIARHVGVSDHTVQKYRAEMESIAQIAQYSERRTGHGRTYPARRPPSVGDDPPPPAIDPDDDPPPEVDFDPPPVVDEADDPPPAAEAEDVPRDMVGNPIRDAQIAADFRQAHELVELRSAVAKIKKTVLDRCEEDHRLYRDITPSSFQADIENVFHTIGHARPYALCPYCGGDVDGCKACHKRGWVNKTTYGVAPPESAGKAGRANGKVPAHK